MGPKQVTEAELQRKARRLALLSAVAQPVQHDLNNLLTVLLGNLDMLRRRATEERAIRQIARAVEATRRLEALTRAVLSLARGAVPDVTVTSPADAVLSLQPLLAVLLPAPGALRVEIDGPVPAARFDRSLLQEALLILAAEAAPDGGTLGVAFASRSACTDIVIALPVPAATRTQGKRAVAMLHALAEAQGGTLSEEMSGGTLSLRLCLPQVAVAAAGTPDRAGQRRPSDVEVGDKPD